MIDGVTARAVAQTGAISPQGETSGTMDPPVRAFGSGDQALRYTRNVLFDRRNFVRTTIGLSTAALMAGAHPEVLAALQSSSSKGVTMKTVKAGVLETAYLESGPADSSPVVLLHGFPYDVHSYDRAAERLAMAGRRVIVPYLRGYGPTRFLRENTLRVGQQAALGSDLLALLDALSLPRATLAGYDWGGRAACVVAALWPERVSGLVSCGTGYNLQNAKTVLKPIEPAMERLHWYWFYLNSERGKTALTQDRSSFCRYLWRDFSPTWHFADETYAQTAASFENPDFVDVVLHSYRYRIGAVPGDPGLEPLEQRLSAQPKLAVPTIVLEGAEDGVDPPAEEDKVRAHFSDLRRLTVLNGVGHNVPQEAPDALVSAVLELGRGA